MRQAQNAIAGPHGIRRGNALQGRRPKLDDKVVERELEHGLAALALGRGGICFLAQRDETIDIDIGDEIKMWNGLLRFYPSRRRALHIPGNDPAMWPRARHAREVNAALAGQPPRQRRDLRAARQSGGAEITLRSHHHMEWIARGERYYGTRTCNKAPLIPAKAGTQLFL